MSEPKPEFLVHQSSHTLKNKKKSKITSVFPSNNSSKKDFLQLAIISNSATPSSSAECVVYHSIQDKTKKLADTYAKTDQLSHRYLAYRDLSSFIKKYVKGNYALDYGAGTGISTAFLNNLGLNVIGVDINSFMLKKARASYPHIQFLEIAKLIPQAQFDLIFSSFVLFDMKSKKEIIEYLEKGTFFLKKSGIFIAITGSEELYSVHRNWIAFDSVFDENRDLHSGDIAKLRLRDPVIEFCDYFWTESDYFDCFQKAQLKILKVHKPLGSENDPYLWKDEKFFSPFTAYILEKQ